MSGFWDVISLCMVIAGIGYMVCIILTLKKVRDEKIKISNVYAYIIIIAIMYILFWLVKIKQ